MSDKPKTDFMDGIAGNFKPLMILFGVLIYFGITINRYYEKYNKSYEQVSITKLTGLDDKEEFELAGFKIKETEIKGQEQGGIGLYVNETDAKPRATIIVEDVEVFFKSFKTKNKIIAKPFQGIHQGSPKFLKNYIINYGVEDENNELKTLLVYEEY
ncbi:MAG: hypothetical protein EOP00_30925, partial [Pedobacter sp.]